MDGCEAIHPLFFFGATKWWKWCLFLWLGTIMACSKKPIWLLLMGASALSVKALTLATPYDAIAKRNLFQLHPAVAAEAPPPKPLPLPKIALTGITTILGRRVAFITINGVRAGDAPQSLMVVEGQVVNGIEVKSIDERAGIANSQFRPGKILALNGHGNF
jgi:hypothetical protein